MVMMILRLNSSSSLDVGNSETREDKSRCDDKQKISNNCTTGKPFSGFGISVEKNDGGAAVHLATN